MIIINDPLYSILESIKLFWYRTILKKSCKDCGWWMPKFKECSWACPKMCINFCVIKKEPK